MQSPPEIKDWIAERELVHRASDGTATSHRVRIGRPLPDEDDWRCEYEIAGPLVTRRRYAVGIDAMQALVLALSIIPAELANIEQATGGTFEWLGETDVGFPDITAKK